MNRKNFVMTILLLFSSAVFLFSENREILLLHSYHQQMTWVQDLQKGVEDILDPENNDISIRIENMDSKVFYSEEYLQMFRDYLSVKYKNISFSLIMCSDNNAYNFLRKHRDDLFPRVPVVFSGVNDFNMEQISGLDNFTGVAEIFSAAETVDLMLRIHENISEIFIINDHLTTGKAWARDIDEDLRDIPGQIYIRHSENVPIAKLREEISELGEGAVVLLGVYFSDSENYHSTYEQIGAMLAEASNVPMYCLLGFNVGKGIVGGNVISGYYQGRMMAELGIDILNGTDPDSIPVVLSGSNQYLFDFNELERFGIAEKKLPENRTIINRPDTFFRKYRTEAGIVLVSFLILVSVILFLIINNKKLHAVERELVSSKSVLEDSESKLQAILDHSPALISIKDEKGNILMVNKEFSSLEGPPVDDYPGRNLFDIFPREIAGKLWKNDLKALHSGKPIEVEEKVKAKDGSLLTYLSVKFPVYISSDKPFGVCAISTNITRRIIIEKELHQVRNYLENIIDSMPSVLIGVDMNLNITLWNKEAEQGTGISNDDAKGRPLTEVYPRLTADVNRITESIRTQKIIKEQRKVLQRIEEIHFEDLIIYPLMAEDDRGAVVRIDDVTDRVKLEEMIVQNEKMLSIGGLAAGMAHEINNPLAGMLQSAGVLSNRLGEKIDMPANQKAAQDAGISIESVKVFMESRGILRLIQSIHESGRRAADIIQNMLSFSRDEKTRRSTCDIKDLCEKTLDLISADYNLSKNYDFKKIKIIREFDDGLPCVVCEGSKIQQVFLNLLKNGAEAMSEAYIENPEIIIRILNKKELGKLIIEIEDNGPGMDEEIRKRVFEPFYTTKPLGVGTGLGLSVSYFIITENHKGKMSVESMPGRGTKFIIALPV